MGMVEGMVPRGRRGSPCQRRWGSALLRLLIISRRLTGVCVCVCVCVQVCACALSAPPHPLPDILSLPSFYLYLHLPIPCHVPAPPHTQPSLHISIQASPHLSLQSS